MKMKIIFYVTFITIHVSRTIQIENSPIKILPDDSRIIGGTKASITEFPHQVSIQLNGFHICGGSIIAKKWVLTAAHCLFGFQLKALKIRSGSTFTTHGGTINFISKVICHEFYNRTTIANDIALIRVKSSFKWKKERRKVALIDAGMRIKSGVMANVIGWGVKKEGGEVSLDLQKVQVPIVSFRVCKIYMRYIERGNICAGYKSGRYDACHGDSGGPLLVNNSLVGIVSSGEGCARPGKPGVYTDVAFYRDWIQSKITC